MSNYIKIVTIHLKNTQTRNYVLEVYYKKHLAQLNSTENFNSIINLISVLLPTDDANV